jgi:Family of unknown function (DUF6461)
VTDPRRAEEAIRRYRWATENSVFGLGACVTLAKGVSPEEALAILVPDGSTDVRPASEVREWAEAFYEPPYANVVEAGALRDWTVVVEDSSGFRATLDGNVEALSRRGEAVVLHQGINADMSFMYARHGVLVRQFEPLMYETMPQVGGPLPHEDGLGFGSREGLAYLAAALVLAERITGLTLTREDLEPSPDRLGIGFRPQW